MGRSLNLKELTRETPPLGPGHRLCAGCTASAIVRLVLMAADRPVVVVNATGCLEVATTVYPYTAWNMPWMHNAFENAAATVSGIEAAYRVRMRRGELREPLYFVAFGGDGGTYDIGLQSLSGALERGHRFVYVCYDNEAYMNTGIQRSSSTPLGSWTTTTPVGSVTVGKSTRRKDLTAIISAHRIPYVAQCAISHHMDLMRKARKAFDATGPAFLNILSPCVPGWRIEPSDTVRVSQMAVDTCFWPLFECEEGKLRVTVQPKEKKPVQEYFQIQGRYRHLLRPEHEALVAKMQQEVDQDWQRLKEGRIL
ncbi:MAG: pyruvate ferredoxin oxidoreductase [Acidobacteria bacterium]|nr:pyruvate ferredoxin oxidoreductase [Acidobacteriota bacterium]